MKKILILLVVCLYSCNEAQDKIAPALKKNTLSAKNAKGGAANAKISGSGSSGVYYGGSINFNGTTIRTFIEATNYNQPTKIGYEMSATVLDNLPNASSPEGTEVSLSLPSLPPTTCSYCPDVYTPPTPQVYNHVTFLWYPNGTDPQGIFSFPKFDFHFYLITEEERMTIGGASDPKQMIAPDPAFIPSNYFGPVGPLAMMGSHWVDLLSPEFNGGTFTRSLIYGSYDAKVVFHSISITRAYLMSGSTINDALPIRQPLAYQINGYYPTKYRIEKNNGSIRIYFSDFISINTDYASY